MSKKVKPTPEQLISGISAAFEEQSGFDITDTEASTHREAVDKAQAHIRWYRLHTEEMAMSMERQLRNTLKEHGLEEYLYNEPTK